MDSSQTISVEEFLGGVPKMFGAAHGLDLVELLSFVKQGNVRVVNTIAQADLLLHQADAVFDKFEDMSGIMKSELHQRKFQETRKKNLGGIVARRNKKIGRVDKTIALRGKCSSNTLRMLGAGRDGGNEDHDEEEESFGGGGDHGSGPPSGRGGLASDAESRRSRPGSPS